MPSRARLRASSAAHATLSVGARGDVVDVSVVTASATGCHPLLSLSLLPSSRFPSSPSSRDAGIWVTEACVCVVPRRPWSCAARAPLEHARKVLAPLVRSRTEEEEEERPLSFRENPLFSGHFSLRSACTLAVKVRRGGRRLRGASAPTSTSNRQRRTNGLRRRSLPPSIPAADSVRVNSSSFRSLFVAAAQVVTVSSCTPPPKTVVSCTSSLVVSGRVSCVLSTSCRRLPARASSSRKEDEWRNRTPRRCVGSGGACFVCVFCRQPLCLFCCVPRPSRRRTPSHVAGG